MVNVYDSLLKTIIESEETDSINLVKIIHYISNSGYPLFKDKRNILKWLMQNRFIERADYQNFVLNRDKINEYLEKTVDKKFIEGDIMANRGRPRKIKEDTEKKEVE